MQEPRVLLLLLGGGWWLLETTDVVVNGAVSVASFELVSLGTDVLFFSCFFMCDLMLEKLLWCVRTDFVFWFAKQPSRQQKNMHSDLRVFGSRSVGWSKRPRLLHLSSSTILNDLGVWLCNFSCINSCWRDDFLSMMMWDVGMLTFGDGNSVVLFSLFFVVVGYCFLFVETKMWEKGGQCGLLLAMNLLRERQYRHLAME
jgi:hypothetical protein